MAPSTTNNEEPPINPLSLPKVQKALLAGSSFWWHPWRRDQVIDLTPLSGLSDLRVLDLWGTGVADVSPLSGLTALETLNLSGTKVADVSPLSGLTALETLNLSGTKVVDVSPLSGLSGLRTLNLSKTGVADLSELSGLRGLEWLFLNETGVTDLSALSELSGLRWLYLRGTKVTDVSPLRGLSGLLGLDLSGTGVKDVSALSKLSRLQMLNLSGTGVKHLSALSELKGLQTLYVDDRGIRNDLELKKLTHLEVIEWKAPEQKASGTVKSSQTPSWLHLLAERCGLHHVTDRYKFRIHDPVQFAALHAIQDDAVAILGGSERYGFVSVSRPPRISDDRFHSALDALCARYGGRLTPEFSFSFDHGDLDSDAALGFDVTGHTGGGSGLDDVLHRIGARNVLCRYGGEAAAVVIAVVDSGVDGTRPEFAVPGKKVGGWAAKGEDPWGSDKTHGTMCALIAAGSSAAGGCYEGVAPRAKLMSCRTSLVDAELVQIYEKLGALARTGTRVIATNSFGFKIGTPPDYAPEMELEFENALADAIADGVIVVCSAGNNHARAGGKANSCTPNSIWRFKGRDDLLTASACDLSGSMLPKASRGRGQFFDAPGTNAKPDVTAPVARSTWGTSGAAPQVAGLLALLLSQRPDLPRDELFDIVRQTAVSLGHPEPCQGQGLIDCTAAVEELRRRTAVEAL